APRCTREDRAEGDAPLRRLHHAAPQRGARLRRRERDRPGHCHRAAHGFGRRTEPAASGEEGCARMTRNGSGLWHGKASCEHALGRWGIVRGHCRRRWYNDGGLFSDLFVRRVLMATAAAPPPDPPPKSPVDGDPLYEMVDGQFVEKPPLGIFETILATLLVEH